MELHSLTLRDVLRFKEEIHIDLVDLPPGLVAIVGPNGEGKTSILEAFIASVYRKLPSRGERALCDVALSDKAAIESVFRYDDQTFRARVAMDPARRSTEAVLCVPHRVDGWAPLGDGKVSTFDDEVKERFPSLAVLLASSFAAQNGAGSFIRAKRRERKELFAELLGLGLLQSFAETARQAEALAAAACHTLEGQLGELAREADALRASERGNVLALQSEFADAGQRAIAAKQAREEVDEQIIDLTKQISALEAGQLAVDAHAAELKRLEADRAMWQRDRDAIEVQARTEREELESGYIAELETLDARAQDAAGLVEARGAEVDHAVQMLPALSDAVDADRATVLEAKETLAEARDRDRVLGEAERQSERLATVPCGGEGEYSACPLILDAVAAREQLSGLRARAGECSVANASAALTAAVRASEVRVEEFRGLSTIADDRDDLVAARATLAGIDAARAALDERRTQQILSIDARRRGALAAAQGRIDRILESIAVAERDRPAGGEHADEMRRLEEQRDPLATKRAQLDVEEHAARETAIRLEGEIDRARAAETRLAEVAARRDQLEAARARLWAESTEWGLAHEALSRDGIQTLEIANAGPSVSALCNDLLESCFGSRFSVELVTEEPRTTGDGMKEVFSLRIFDNERGGQPRDISDLSGGEQIIVDEALKAAIGVFLNQQGAVPIRTCFRDETTGALDPDNARRYVAMLRRLLDVGDYHQILFVSHNLDAAALADAQIQVGGGAVTPALPPFNG